MLNYISQLHLLALTSCTFALPLPATPLPSPFPAAPLPCSYQLLFLSLALTSCCTFALPLPAAVPLPCPYHLLYLCHAHISCCTSVPLPCSALQSLSDFGLGEEVLPVTVLKSRRRLDLVGRALEAKPTNYRNSQRLMKLATLLRAENIDNLEGVVWAMVARKALQLKVRFPLVFSKTMLVSFQFR